MTFAEIGKVRARNFLRHKIPRRYCGTVAFQLKGGVCSVSFQGKIPAPVHPMEGNAEKNMTPLVLPLYFCGAAGTSYFFRLFPLLGEMLTFVDFFILCFFVCYMPSFAIIRAYSFTAHPPLNGVPSPLTRRSRPWKAVLCPDLFKGIFTPVSPQFHRRPPSGSPGGCPCKHGIWGQMPLARDALEPYASAVHQPFTG